jgi:DNA-binding transcriptional ArsR family regulator
VRRRAKPASISASKGCATAQPFFVLPARLLLAIDQQFKYRGIMEEMDVVRALAALAQPVRLRVFRALVIAGTGGLTPGTMAEGLGIPANTLSFHLKELAAAGLVTQERASRNLIYRAAYDRMNSLLGFLTENCCAGSACVAAPVSAARRC